MNENEAKEIIQVVKTKEPKMYSVDMIPRIKELIAIIKCVDDFHGCGFDDRDIANCVKYIKSHCILP